MSAPNANTPVSIIADAYFDAGLLQEGQSPSGEQLVTGMRKLGDMINLWQTQGLKLWLCRSGFDRQLLVDQNLLIVSSRIDRDRMTVHCAHCIDRCLNCTIVQSCVDVMYRTC